MHPFHKFFTATKINTINNLMQQDGDYCLLRNDNIYSLEKKKIIYVMNRIIDYDLIRYSDNMLYCKPVVCPPHIE